jgi:hypothetical protein
VCRDAIARSGPRTVTRASLVMALYFLGDSAGATTASEGLLAAADATANPNTACFALLAIGTAYRDVDPVTAYDVLRRALTVARVSGNRQMEAATAVTLSMVAATNDDHIDSLAHLALAIRHYLDAGSLSLIHFPLASLVGAFDRLGRHEQAATVSGFATNPVARAGYPQIDAAITHLRDILGEQKYEACARAGERMSIAAIATYALAEIEEARAETNGRRNRRDLRVPKYSRDWPVERRFGATTRNDYGRLPVMSPHIRA